MKENNININDDTLEFIKASIEEGITRGVDIATTNAVNIMEERKSKRKKHIYDNRLNNTKLLMKNYRRFKEAISSAVFSESGLDTMTVGEVLSKIEDLDSSTSNEVIVESILKSKKKTEIILSHIDKVLKRYFKKVENSKDERLKERAEMFKMYYIDEKNENITYEEMSIIFHMSGKQINRNIARVASDVSIMLFGFDGLECLI